MATSLTAIYRFNAIPTKTPTQFFIKLKRAICKFNWNNNNNKKKIEDSERISGGITIPDLKLYYTAIVIKNFMVLVQKQAGRSMK